MNTCQISVALPDGASLMWEFKSKHIKDHSYFFFFFESLYLFWLQMHIILCFDFQMCKMSFFVVIVVMYQSLSEML